MRHLFLGMLVLVLSTNPLLADNAHLRYLPSDTRVVLTIHPAALDESKRQEGQELLRQVFLAFVAPELDAAEKLPLGDLSRVVVALPYAGSMHSTLLLEGKLDSTLFDKQMAVAARAGVLTSARMGNPPANVHRRLLDERRILTFAPPLARIPPVVRKLVIPQEVSLTLLDSRTVFVSLMGRVALERALRARPAGNGVRIPEELGKLLEKQDEKDVAVLTLLPECLHPGLHLLADEETRETFEDFEHIVARFRLGKEVSITIDIESKSSDLAPTLQARSKKALAALRQLLPKAVEKEAHRRILDALLASFSVSRKDTRVTLEGKLSIEDARRLLTLPAR